MFNEGQGYCIFEEPKIILKTLFEKQFFPDEKMQILSYKNVELVHFKVIKQNVHH